MRRACFVRLVVARGGQQSVLGSERRRGKDGRYNAICIVSLGGDDTVQVDHACFGDVGGLYRIVYGYRHICERTVIAEKSALHN